MPSVSCLGRFPLGRRQKVRRVVWLACLVPLLDWTVLSRRASKAPRGRAGTISSDRLHFIDTTTIPFAYRIGSLKSPIISLSSPYPLLLSIAFVYHGFPFNAPRGVYFFADLPLVSPFFDNISPPTCFAPWRPRSFSLPFSRCLNNICSLALLPLVMCAYSSYHSPRSALSRSVFSGKGEVDVPAFRALPSRLISQIALSSRVQSIVRAGRLFVVRIPLSPPTRRTLCPLPLFWNISTPSNPVPY